MLESKTEIPRWMPIDRRRGQDRRSVERRKLAIDVPSDRRSGPDRRRVERRTGAERRVRGNPGSAESARHTLLPFSRGEAEQLKLLIRSGKPGCPSCGQMISAGPVITRGDHAVREYRCLRCRKGVMVRQA